MILSADRTVQRITENRMRRRLAEERSQGNRLTQPNIDEHETPYIFDTPGVADL
ncbi:MAG: hypothetical protein OTJ43_02610 [Dehalococcoidia bacterium]|nr:hypothetical protein [Dehalococcoidia bacterium]